MSKFILILACLSFCGCHCKYNFGAQAVGEMHLEESPLKKF
jgi:hypothetical protein